MHDPLALNTSMPSSSQTLGQNVDPAKSKGKQTVSASALASASSTAVAVKPQEPAKEGTTVATNDTATGTGGHAGILACGVMKRWTIRGRIAAYLTARDCVAPIAEQPTSGLLPVSNEPSSSKSNPDPTPIPDSQTPKDSQQTGSQQTGSQQTSSQQTDSQPAKDAAQIEPQPAKAAAPAVAPAAITSPVVVQGQTVPANGDTITISSQPVKLSSGSIYVGSSAAPIPQAQATQLHVGPIVANSLTLQPASPSQVLKVAPSPVVVGGLTFSAPQAEPSVETNAKPDQDQVQQVVVGGKTYAPVSPTDEAKNPQIEANTPVQGSSEPSASNGQSDSAVDSGQSELNQLNPVPAEADSKPIVIGDTTYTPVAASPRPTPQNAAVYYYSGVALTQGGSAITVSGTRISLGPSGVVVGSSTIPLSTLTPTTSLLQIGSQTFTALRGNEKGFEIDHTPLLPGSSAISVDGTRYSIDEAGSLISGTSTIALATAGSSNTSDSALTAGGETFTPLGSTAVVVDGSTLSVGGSAITEDGTKVSLASSGLVVGSSTFAYATPVANVATVSSASGTSSTGALPSGGTIATTFPSATGGVERSAASGKTWSRRLMTKSAGVSVFLSISIGMF